jgi:hypothetical protein
MARVRPIGWSTRLSWSPYGDEPNESALADGDAKCR